MGSAGVLAVLPAVFTTDDYRRAAGTDRPSSAGALEELAAQAAVRKSRRDTWYNPSGDMPSTQELLVEAGPVSHLWSVEWEMMLEAVYGNSPRRISGLAALAMAGAALICEPEVTVETRLAVDTSGFGFASRRESPRTLLIGAAQLTERTWVSTPARAVLECAQHPGRYHRYEEYLGRMLANRFDVCPPAEVVETAGTLGWRAGLRRLSSIADKLGQSETGKADRYDVDPDWAKIAASAETGDRPIKLVPRDTRIGDTDQARKVAWNTTFEGLAQLVST